MTDCEFCGEQFESDQKLHLHWYREHEDELNSHQEEKAKKANKQEEKQKQQRKQDIKKYSAYGLAALAVVGLAVGFVPQIIDNTGQSSSNLNLANQPSIGDENASVTVVEFGDYKCPYCKTFDQTVYNQLEENYIDSGQVEFYFVNYPFLAQDSTTAAVASECVYRQDADQFWDFHHALYEAQGSERNAWATQNRLMEIARDSTENLSYSNLSTCISQRQTIDSVNADRKIGNQNQVSSTPTVIVNGKTMGNWEYSALRSQIEKELQS